MSRSLAKLSVWSNSGDNGGCRKDHPSRGTRRTRRAAMKAETPAQTAEGGASVGDSYSSAGRPGLTKTWHLIAEGVQGSVEHRGRRPLLGMIGVPLAIGSALLAGQLGLVMPLAACAWWWAPTDWEWYWLAAVGRGVLTAMWGTLGVTAIGAFPDDTLRVSVVWVATPGLLALSAVVTPGDLWPADPSAAIRLRGISGVSVYERNGKATAAARAELTGRGLARRPKGGRPH
jgi:hypothetical protein